MKCQYYSHPKPPACFRHSPVYIQDHSSWALTFTIFKMGFIEAVSLVWLLMLAMARQSLRRIKLQDCTVCYGDRHIRFDWPSAGKRWKLSTSMQQSGWWIDFKPNSSHWLPHMRSHLWLLLCGCTRSTRRTNFEPSRRADLDPILHKGCRPLWWKDASLKPSQEPSYKFVRTVWTINNSSCKLSFKPFRK